MTKETKKQKHVATCEHCNKITDITISKAITGMEVELEAQREELTDLKHKVHVIRRQKFGERKAFHLMIKELYGLMTPEQRTKAFEHSQRLRDEIKRINKI